MRRRVLWNEVVSSCNCRCVHANSKLHELVRKRNMLLCFYPLISSIFRHVVWWQCHKHVVSAPISDTIYESVHSVTFRTYPWVTNTSYTFSGSVRRHSVQKQHKIPLTITSTDHSTTGYSQLPEHLPVSNLGLWCNELVLQWTITQSYIYSLSTT